MSELRWNPLRQEWVATASARQERTFLPPADHCPLCPTRPGGFPTEVPEPAYQIAVLQNRFPPLWPDPPEPTVGGTALWPVHPSRGAAEVVLYTDQHSASLASQPDRQIEHLVQVWTDRYRQLGGLPYVDYVYVFENRGAAVGVTLHHPHGQIYGYPFVPPVARIELDAGANHRRLTGRCLLCDLVAAEREDGRRIVFENERFAVYCPFGARYPYETHIVARAHLPSLQAFDSADVRAFAAVLGRLVRTFDRLFDTPLPYIMAMHQAPTDGQHYADAHFHVEFYPLNRTKDRLKYLAGSEAGAGVFVTDLLPETTAATLRDLVVK